MQRPVDIRNRLRIPHRDRRRRTVVVADARSSFRWDAPGDGGPSPPPTSTMTNSPPPRLDREIRHRRCPSSCNRQSDRRHRRGRSRSSNIRRRSTRPPSFARARAMTSSGMPPSSRDRQPLGPIVPARVASRRRSIPSSHPATRMRTHPPGGCILPRRSGRCRFLTHRRTRRAHTPSERSWSCRQACRRARRLILRLSPLPSSRLSPLFDRRACCRRRQGCSFDLCVAARPPSLFTSACSISPLLVVSSGVSPGTKVDCLISPPSSL